jgi:glutamate-1-semialdehyde 2,1-aminomutase
LRALSREQNIVLIFDEVITGFRFTYGGAQNYFEVKPDLTCLGKIIGGGLPIGAVGGKKEIMELLAPQGQVYQAGTFSGKPHSVSAGLATLKKLGREDSYPRLYALTRHLSERIEQAAQKSGCAVRVNCIGSLFSIFFTDREVIDYHTAKTQDEGAFKVFYHGLLREGVYFSPSGFEANFLSAAHTAGDIEKTGQAIEKALKSRPFRTVKIARGEKTNSRGETQ